jgi:hypothetical protein
VWRLDLEREAEKRRASKRAESINFFMISHDDDKRRGEKGTEKSEGRTEKNVLSRSEVVAEIFMQQQNFPNE